MRRSSLIGLRVENQLLDKFEKIIHSQENPKGGFPNMSECIRELAKIGYELLKHKEDMQDPKKSEEFLKKMGEIIEQDKVMDWLQGLSDSQLEGFLMAHQMEKERRYENK